MAWVYRSLFFDLNALLSALTGKVRDGGAILEIGAGEGQLAERIAVSWPSISVLGIDLTARVGRLCESGLANVRFRQVRADVLAVEAPARFDLVILCDVLHHVAPGERASLLAAAASLCAPHGYVAVKDWEQRRSVADLLAWLSDRWLTGDRVRYFGDGELRSLLESAYGVGSVVEEWTFPPVRNNIGFLATPWRVREV